MKRNLTLAVLTGILLALSFPPFKTGFLAYGALIPFFLLLEGIQGMEAFRWGYVTGLFADIATLFWIGWVTVPGAIGALLVLPLFFGIYGLLHTLVIKRLALVGYFALPFLWIGIEYLQTFGETAFPWMFLGYTQTYYLPLIQYAEYTSVLGVSFWLAMLNVMLFVLWKKDLNSKLRRSIFAGFLALFLIPLIHGTLVLQGAKAADRSVRVALVQGNVDPFEKWDEDFYDRNFDIYDQDSRQAMKEEPDLLIWPETALPFYLRHEHKQLEKVRRLADSLKTPILTGSLDFDYDDRGNYRYYNAALLLEPFDRRIQHYSKTRLVPFSERVPYKDYFPFNLLKKILYDMVLGIGDYSFGKAYQVLTFVPGRVFRQNDPALDGGHNSSYRFAAPICFESLFPDLIRQFALQKINFLAIITNDAWFGKTSAPFQHAQIAVMRAIENRTAIARCANTGVSCFIDPYGRVIKATKIFQKMHIVCELPLCHKTTFYTKHGNVFANMSSVIAIVSVLYALYLAIRGKAA
jgi:apolipoprotein N-acyltransferase